MRTLAMVAVIAIGLASPAHAERVTVGGVTVEAPAGFALRGSALVADKAGWAFATPEAAPDPDAWMASSWKAVAATFTDVRALPSTKQPLGNGFVLYIAAATAGDSRGGDHYLMLLGAYRPDSKRMYPSVFDASTSARFAELAPKVATAVASFAIAPASDSATSEAPKAPPPASTGTSGALPVPDGTYACFSLFYDAALRMPSYQASVLGQIVLHGTTYDSPSYKGSGSVRGAGARLEFTSGPFAGWVAASGSDSSGVFIRFGKDHKAPAESTQIGDHVCRKR